MVTATTDYSLVLILYLPTRYLSFNMPATRTSKRKQKSTAKPMLEMPEVAQEPEQGEQDIMGEVAKLAEESVDEMTRIEEDPIPSENGNEGGRQASESTTSNGSEAPKLTMEERKAKLTQLRKKIVCLSAIL